MQCKRPTSCLESESWSSREASWDRKVPKLASWGASLEVNSGQNQVLGEEEEAKDCCHVKVEEVEVEVEEVDQIKALVVEVVAWGGPQECEKLLYRMWTSECLEVEGTRLWNLAMSQVRMMMWSSSLIGGRGGERKALGLELVHFFQRDLDLVRQG